MSLKSFQAHGQALVGGVAIHEPVAETTRQLPVVEGKGKSIATNEQAVLSLLDLHKPKKKSTTDQYVRQRCTPATEDASTGPSTQPEDDTSANKVHDTPSPTDAKTSADTDKTNSKGDTEILNVSKEQGEDVSNKVDLEEKTVELDEGQARSDPGKTHESRPPPKHVLMEEDHAGPNHGQSYVDLARPNPEPMHDDFVSIVYPKVHESLKHKTKEHVHLENPLSSSGTLSSMKNLEDNFTFGDQFINDKPTEKDPGKINVETEVESMVTIPIHQASPLVPPLSTPVIDLTPLQHVSSTIQELVFTATHAATTTTTLPPPPPLQQQSSTDPELANRVSALEKMKEILYDRMFKSGSYKSHPKHKALYEALEASMVRDSREKFLKTIAKSQKGRRNDQDPYPPPPKDSDQIKKKEAGF
nr:hypothetical protein [Tanacetum cinerariifolium]